MEKIKKIKIFIALFYVSVILLFLYFFFTKFTIQELTSYDFIKNNRDYFFNLRETNLLYLGFFFFLFCIVWTFAAGFATPLALFSGFIFGKYLGTIVVVVSISVGATGLYVFANYFLKEIIKDKFLNRFKNLEEKFKKSELSYLLIYRFVGGIPFAISNVLPCIFNVKVSNFFWATLIGIFPQVFLICSIGSGLEKIIDQNLNPPGIIDIIFFPDIYIPLIVFIGLIVVLIFFRKIFYK